MDSLKTWPTHSVPNRCRCPLESSWARGRANNATLARKGSALTSWPTVNRRTPKDQTRRMRPLLKDPEILSQWWEISRPKSKRLSKSRSLERPRIYRTVSFHLFRSVRSRLTRIIVAPPLAKTSSTFRWRHQLQEALNLTILRLCRPL